MPLFRTAVFHTTVADLRDLVESIVEKAGMGRRHGLAEAFDDVLGRPDGTEE